VHKRGQEADAVGVFAVDFQVVDAFGARAGGYGRHGHRTGQTQHPFPSGKLADRNERPRSSDQMGWSKSHPRVRQRPPAAGPRRPSLVGEGASHDLARLAACR